MFIASSPGRLDVMGGIADYSGALVLQMPLKEHTTVRLVPRNDLMFLIHSNDQHCKIDFSDLITNQSEHTYEFAKRYFKTNPDRHWVSYIVGCVLVLQKEKGIVPKGFEILIDSDVPIGKGVSSSAALEVATMKALAAYYNLSFEGTELPILAQKVENLIVGAPCGLMDQLASYFGKPNQLLPILCQPDVLSPTIPLPSNLRFVGIDSGLRHSVGGSSYTDVRTAAFMGLKIINDFSGLDEMYLANISKDEFEQKYATVLPKSLRGDEFIAKYNSTKDTVTTINPEVYYAVYEATKHPVYENSRINSFAEVLKKYAHQNIPKQEVIRLGQWMFESHSSYSACGLGSSATDRIVEMVRVNSERAVYGAKITGGGSGGTVCVLCDGDQGLETAHQIHQNYCAEIGSDVKFFG